MDAVVAQRLNEPSAPANAPPQRRELLAEIASAAAFLGAAAACAAWNPGHEGWPAWWVVATLVALMAVAFRVRFSVGAYDALPTQLVFVPMLFIVPLGFVPLVLAGSYLLARVPAYVSGRRSPWRAVMVLGDAWYAIGPVLVLGAAGVHRPEWGDWPWLLLALAAQLVVDTAATAAREALARGARPSLASEVDGWVELVDVLLSPVGFLAAIASQQSRLAFLAVAPLGVALVVFSREREGRIAAALEAARVSQRLVETERAAARVREELIAGASHELQTPLAVVLGLARTLQRDDAMSPERRAEAHATLGREATRMGHLVRGFLDYTRLKADRGIDVRAQAVELGPLARAVADTVDPDIAVRVDGAARVQADRDRLALALHNVLANARRHGGPGTVAVTARAAPGRVELLVDDAGPGVPAGDRERIFEEFARGDAAVGTEGAGLGLYVAREVLRAQGATIAAADAPGGGARFVISLPAA